MLPVVAVPLVLLLEHWGEHTACLMAASCEEHPLKVGRERQDLLVEGALSGHRQVLAGTQGLRLSEGSHLLHPGCQDQKCCLGIPQTRSTRGSWCPRGTNHGGVRESSAAQNNY